MFLGVLKTQQDLLIFSALLGLGIIIIMNFQKAHISIIGKLVYPEQIIRFPKFYRSIANHEISRKVHDSYQIHDCHSKKFIGVL